jgi:type I restriction enzyme S subunit
MVVPKGWSHNKLSDIAIINPKKSRRLKDDDLVTFLAMSDISEDGRVLNYQTRKYSEVCEGYTPFENGDIIIAKITPCFENGKGALVTRLLNGIGFGSTELHVLRPLKNKISKEFLFQFINSRHFRKLGKANMVGTAGQKRVPVNFISTYKFIFPPLPEQRKIATILFVWDKAIEKVTFLIDVKRNFKQALMQELLTGKLRFKEFVKSNMKTKTHYGVIPGDWEYSKVEEIADEVSDRNEKGRNIPVLSCTKYDGLVDSLQYFGKRIFSEDTSDYKIVRRDQFAYATNHIEEGSIGLLDSLDKGLVSPMYTVFKTDENVYAPYLYKVFKTELYRHIFEANTSGSIDRRGGLRWKQFSQIHIPLPSIEEQKKIFACIDTRDREIRLLQQLVEALKTQKKGLMQKLLTGKIRVKV